jgi:hypothetical protein
MGPGNSWVDNHGQTSMPPGLCKPGTHQDDQYDATTYQATADSSGWDPNHARYNDYPDALGIDWPTTYSAIDTQSLLNLLPQVGLGLVPPPSPMP